ncbi:MAG: hypothetical protein CMH52_03060 [Myxococcales bacterium]|nr:hypothetical protein [Myxococcales bacterium]|tara:strand:+ start:2076 stop:2762 length:687 start_codon:yes stop_codon:yes gene_type:complete
MHKAQNNGTTTKPQDKRRETIDTKLLINDYVFLQPIHKIRERPHSEIQGFMAEWESWAFKLSAGFNLKVVPPWTWHVTLMNTKEWDEIRKSEKELAFPDFKLGVEMDRKTLGQGDNMFQRCNYWNLGNWNLVTDLKGRMSLQIEVTVEGAHAWRGNLGLDWEDWQFHMTVANRTGNPKHNVGRWDTSIPLDQEVNAKLDWHKFIGELRHCPSWWGNRDTKAMWRRNSR